MNEINIYNIVAALQSIAWKRLAELNPNYTSSNVEEIDEWIQARKLMEYCLEKNSESLIVKKNHG